jgi:hypothetical protein
MTKAGLLTACCALISGAVIAGCSGSSVTLTPAGTPPTPNAGSLPPPFAALQFDILPIGPQITDGYDCPVGIITSKTELPDVKRRATIGRAPRGVFPITGGCDPKAGFPIVSPYPTQAPPTPMPLATAALATQAITAPSAALALPAVAGWSGTLTFPACNNPGTCDAGTTNGSIGLSVLQGTTAAAYTFALSFKYTGPENLAPPTPPPSQNPASHIWNLYGPPGPVPKPIPTFLSGAPINLGFPSLSVTVPSGSAIVPGHLVLTLSQVLTPPVYEIQIANRNAAGDFLAIPLRSNATYQPYASNATSAQFALPSTPFAFQTDFTQYVFSLEAGS